MENLSIIPAASTFIGFLFSCNLYKRLQDITSSLKKAHIEKPSDHSDISHYLEIQKNKIRWDSFYKASNILIKVLYGIFFLAFLIFLITFAFTLDENAMDIRIELSSSSVLNNKIKSTLTFKSATGKTKLAELNSSRNKIKLLQLDLTGDITISEIPLEDRASTYLFISKDGEVEKVPVREVLISLLIFVFIIILALCYFIIGRIEDDIVNFEELN